jgi:hypothetical protein
MKIIKSYSLFTPKISQYLEIIHSEEKVQEFLELNKLCASAMKLRKDGLIGDKDVYRIASKKIELGTELLESQAVLCKSEFFHNSLWEVYV